MELYALRSKKSGYFFQLVNNFYNEEHGIYVDNVSWPFTYEHPSYFTETDVDPTIQRSLWNFLDNHTKDEVEVVKFQLTKLDIK